MRKELPINRDIPYSGMVRDRNRLIAILANQANMSWYAENFIPLLLYPNGNIHCYDTTNYYEIFSVYDQVIKKKKRINIDKDIIKEEIDNNRYVIALVDEYYLCGSVYFQSEHRIQEILLYGYDDCHESFLFHGSQIDKQDYGCSECNYYSLEKALFCSAERIDEIESVSWRVLFGHPLSSFTVCNNIDPINIYKVFYHFNNLLIGKSIIVSKGQETERYYSGISLYEELRLRFEQIRVDDKQSSERAIWCIKLLAGYFKYYKVIFGLLEEQHGIVINSELNRAIDILSQKVMSIYSLLQKYCITGIRRNIDRAMETIETVKRYSEMIWNTVVDAIQDHLLNTNVQ